jgi:hypothetical protein
MEELKAKVITNDGTHGFKVGQIVTLIEEVTHIYYGDDEEIEERYFTFIDENGYVQDLSDDVDFKWLK